MKLFMRENFISVSKELEGAVLCVRNKRGELLLNPINGSGTETPDHL